MKYKVLWTGTSLRQIEKLDKKTATRIINKVEDISVEPFLSVKKLSGFDLYSLRIGDYRAIMSMEKNKMIIFVLQVGHRSKIYKKY